MTPADRLQRDALVAEAVAGTGEDDFGDPSWQEGLDVLLGSLLDEARLNELGVEVVATELVTYLSNRLLINAWHRDHPEVGRESITQPIVIVGQPRTGTTILFDLLAQDPELRAPLTWEVDCPVPPPETATFDTDPRIAEVQASLDMAESLIPGFTSFHPMGARLGQECVRITGGDFRSMIFSTQYRLPTYSRWLLHDADLGSAYRWHRKVLQLLQSRHPARQWLLKSPAHLWHLEALAAEYPDALVVQTHRDPLKVIASVSALAAHLRQLASDDTSISEASPAWADDIFFGLDRGMEARDNGAFPVDRVVDVQFSEFMDDPFSTIRKLYAALGRELTSTTEASMRSFLTEHPGDGGGGRYRFADTGLNAEVLRQRSAIYQQRYNVPSEPVN